jgi:hypothetical protein
MPLPGFKVSEADNYTAQSARLAGRYLFGGLLTLGIVIFSLLVSGDTYFNALTYEILACMQHGRDACTSGLVWHSHGHTPKFISW